MNQPKIDVVTHQPPPYNDQMRIQTGKVFPQNQISPAYIGLNGQIVGRPYVDNGRHFLRPLQTTPTILDYLNTIWSVINTCCCLWPAGFIAFMVSIFTLRMRHRGDNECAKIAGIVTAVINVIATVGGILLFIFYFLPRIKTYNQD
jgi:hypothetical protein